MGLKEDIAVLTPRQRRFLLFRIADVDPDTARKLTLIKRGTYNFWLHDDTFVALHRRRDEWAASSKEEAIKLLRRDNQLAAVLMEEKIISKMREEVESGEYNLIRTNLAREVYMRLISELDVVPQTKSLTWNERIQNLFLPNPPQVLGRVDTHMEAINAQLQENVDAQYAETDSSQKNELAESQTIQKGQ